MLVRLPQLKLSDLCNCTTCSCISAHTCPCKVAWLQFLVVHT